MLFVSTLLFDLRNKPRNPLRGRGANFFRAFINSELGQKAVKAVKASMRVALAKAALARGFF